MDAASFSSLSSAAAMSYGGGSSDDRRKQSLEQGNHPLMSLNLNLDALAQSGAAPRAQELLQRIHALYQEGYYEVSPDVVSYNSVLKAWKEDNNPTKAYELLQEMIQLEDEEVRVDVISFNTVILAFAKGGNYPQAEDLLRCMQQRHDFPNPDTVTFNAVLYAFAQSRDPGSAIQAENLLREMISQNVTVDTTSFNTVIYAWSQTADASSLAGAYRAQQLLDHMEQLAAAGSNNVEPDVYSYTTLIQAWAKCEQPLESNKILERMSSRGLTPNRFTHTAVMSSLAKAGEPEKAERILNEMMEAYMNGNDDLKPDTVSFSSVMDGWARLSSVYKPFAADRALALLDRMKELESEGMGPNAITYTSLLTALAKSGRWEACDKAREIVEEMEAEFEQGNYALRPTTIHYNTVLNAYARSPRKDKAMKASNFLRLMKQKSKTHNCRPDIISYNALLMACANAFGDEDLREKSFDIAVNTFKTIMSKPEDDESLHRVLRPTSTTFVLFCKATRKLVSDPDKQRSILNRTLKLCCDRGLLDHVVVQQVQMACKNEEEWRETAGPLSQNLRLNDKLRKKPQVPKQWVCNANYNTRR